MTASPDCSCPSCCCIPETILSQTVSMLEIVKLRAELGQRHRLPCHHIELLHLTGSQFIAEFLPEACLHASIASSVSSDGVTDVTAQCCSAARGPSAQMQRQLHVKTLHNKPNPGPGLVTRLQTVTAANFTAAADPLLQIQSGRKPEQPSYLCLS